ASRALLTPPMPLFLHHSCHTHHPHSFPTRRSSDLRVRRLGPPREPGARQAHAADPTPNRTCWRGTPELRRRPRAPDHRRARRCRSEEHTSELQSPYDLVCRLLLEKKKKNKKQLNK